MYIRLSFLKECSPMFTAANGTKGVWGSCSGHSCAITLKEPLYSSGFLCAYLPLFWPWFRFVAASGVAWISDVVEDTPKQDGEEEPRGVGDRDGGSGLDDAATQPAKRLPALTILCEPQLRPSVMRIWNYNRWNCETNGVKDIAVSDETTTWSGCVPVVSRVYKSKNSKTGAKRKLKTNSSGLRPSLPLFFYFFSPLCCFFLKS